MKFAITGSMLRREDELSLASYGYETIKIPPCEAISGSVCAHSDIVLFFLHGKLFLPLEYYRKNARIIDRILTLGNLSPIFTRSLPCSPYPGDVPLCALNAGDRALIANKNFLAPEITDFCDGCGIPVFHSRQGYAKCSALYMGGVISSDPSILKACAEASLDALAISPGGIRLPGYDHGFIGGACGFDGEAVYFCGSLDSHPDAERIKNFCGRRGVGCRSLSSLPLLDVGSVFFI